MWSDIERSIPSWLLVPFAFLGMGCLAGSAIAIAIGCKLERLRDRREAREASEIAASRLGTDQ